MPSAGTIHPSPLFICIAAEIYGVATGNASSIYKQCSRHFTCPVAIGRRPAHMPGGYRWYANCCLQRNKNKQVFFAIFNTILKR
jgi:hypothetical protein